MVDPEVDPDSPVVAGVGMVETWPVAEGSSSSLSMGSTSSSSLSILSAHSPPDRCEPGLKRVSKSSEKPAVRGWLVSE